MGARRMVSASLLVLLLLGVSMACSASASTTYTTNSLGNGTSGAQSGNVVKLKAVALPPSPLDLALNANRMDNKAVGTAIISNPQKYTVEVSALVSSPLTDA